MYERLIITYHHAFYSHIAIGSVMHTLAFSYSGSGATCQAGSRMSRRKCLANVFRPGSESTMRQTAEIRGMPSPGLSGGPEAIEDLHFFAVYLQTNVYHGRIASAIFAVL